VETEGAAQVSGSWDEEEEHDEEVEKGKFMSWVGRWWDWKKGGDDDETTKQAAADDAELPTVGVDERVDSAEGEVSELVGQQGEEGEQLGLMLNEQPEESGAFSLPAHRMSLTACTNRSVAVKLCLGWAQRDPVAEARVGRRCGEYGDLTGGVETFGASTEDGWGREKLNSLLVVVANVPLAPWMEGTLKRFAAAELDREQAASASADAADGDATSVSRVKLKGAVRVLPSALVTRIWRAA
jgi:hypothetical protein